MISLILCAAGRGERAKTPENKIFFEWNGLPVLVHSLSAFSPFVDEMLVACSEEDEKRVQALLSPFENARTVLGGNTRTESVYHALKEAKGEIVLVHDAARPFVSAEAIEGCIGSVKKFGSGVCAVPSTDTVALTENGYKAPPRNTVFLVQTPQGFLREELLRAYEKAMESGKSFTDDSGIYAEFCKEPHLCAGDNRNKKLTFPADFEVPERVGFGIDTHAFDHQDEIDKGIARLNLNYIKLCGVTVPSDRALVAHSDGDVPVHALMDALLSSIGERDIGFFFPDTDPAYAGADSMKLLEKVMELVHGGGFFVKNASIAIVCERPRLSPHIDRMRENLRRTLDCENVGISAGTNEKLGYVGEGKGITAYATVLLGRKN